WVSLAPAETDGLVEVRAVVYPHSGYCRVLQGGYITAIGSSAFLPSSEQSLLLWSNGSGSYTKTPVWVDATDGVDEAGRGTEALPYKTASYAVSQHIPADNQTFYFKAGIYL